jgi:hypothetical protein
MNASEREKDTVISLVPECWLQDTKAAFSAWIADGHTAELAKELVPLLDLDPLLDWGDRIEDGQEAHDTVR